MKSERHELTPEQHKLVKHAGDQPVRVVDPKTNIAYVIVPAATFDKMCESLERELDRSDSSLFEYEDYRPSDE